MIAIISSGWEGRRGGGRINREGGFRRIFWGLTAFLDLVSLNGVYSKIFTFAYNTGLFRGITAPSIECSHRNLEL